MPDVDLNFLARQMERVIANTARLQDDMAVLTAIVIRLDHTATDLLTEIRALHTQIARMNVRLTKLENTEG